MILINLLPHREARRQARKRAYFASLGIAAGVGVALAGLWYTVLQQMISAQQSRNAFLSGEVQRLESQIKDIATLRTEIDALKSRQKAVEDLQANRNVPVHLLDELVKQTPEGIYLNTIKQADQIVSITGIAQTNERVSEMLRNTAYNSPWFERPELIEIKATTVQLANKEQRRLFDFSMRLTLKGLSPPSGAASGAAAARSVS